MNTLNVLSLFSICLLFSACGLDWTMRETLPYENPRESHAKQNEFEYSLPTRIGEPVKCYAQCVYTDFYSNETEQIFEFNGTHYNVKDLKRKTIVHSPATTRWEKGKPDPNCISPNPEDCIVMCLVDVPADKEIYYVFNDTITNKEFKITEARIKDLVKTDANSDLVEVLCEIEITNEIINNLNQKLIDLGYLNENLVEDKQRIGEETKDAIRSYQEAQGLPIGGKLNIPTLEHLGLYSSSED